MNPQAKYEISQIIQNSDFWQLAQSALRFADSQLVARRAAHSQIVTAQLSYLQSVQTNARTVRTQELQLADEHWYEFVRYWLRYVGKWKGGSFYHNCNFAKHSPGRPRTKTMDEHLESFTEEGEEKTTVRAPKVDKRTVRQQQPDSVILRALKQPPLKEE